MDLTDTFRKVDDALQCLPSAVVYGADRIRDPEQAISYGRDFVQRLRQRLGIARCNTDLLIGREDLVQLIHQPRGLVCCQVERRNPCLG